MEDKINELVKEVNRLWFALKVLVVILAVCFGYMGTTIGHKTDTYQIEQIQSQIDVDKHNIDNLYKNDSVIVSNQKIVQTRQEQRDILSTLFKLIL